MFHIQISKICRVMREYQKINNTIEMCMTNSQILYDIIKASFPLVDVKAKAVICCNTMDAYSDDIDKTPILKQTIHLMIIADGIYYEPSYELYSLKGVQYFSSIKNLLEGVIPNDIIKNNIKNTLQSFLIFVEHEKSINSGNFLITDKDYYNNQLDYIQTKLN
jgi:hypothetical protein